jgi:hypothetical protein
MKNIKLAPRWIAVFGLLSVILLLNLSTVFGAHLDGGGPVPGGPGYVAISALAFKPHDVSPSLIQHDQSAIYTNSGTGYWVEAPVDLPNGAVINQIVVYYSTATGATPNFNVILFLHPLYSNSPITIASFSPSSSSADINTYTSATYNGPFTYPNVALASNAYMVQVNLPNNTNIRFNGVRIDYAYTASLPAVMK